MHIGVYFLSFFALCGGVSGCYLSIKMLITYFSKTKRADEIKRPQWTKNARKILCKIDLIASISWLSSAILCFASGALLIEYNMNVSSRSLIFVILILLSFAALSISLMLILFSAKKLYKTAGIVFRNKKYPYFLRVKYLSFWGKIERAIAYYLNLALCVIIVLTVGVSSIAIYSQSG